MKLITVKIAYASSLIIPLSVSYDSSEWHRWSGLKIKKETKKGVVSDRLYFNVVIPQEAGVYEVRTTFGRKTWIHIGSTHGKKGLHDRLSQLLNLETGTHSHRDKILDHLIEAYQERKGIHLSRVEATHFLEVRWSTCVQPELLELLLHIRYKPQLPDERLFPQGMLLQGIPADYKQILSAQDNEPISDDEPI